MRKKELLSLFYISIIMICLFTSGVVAQEGDGEDTQQAEKKKKKKVDCPVIGIDLGTTYSCVGIYKNGHVEIIPNELGNRITPSVVAFTDEERLIGEAAKNQAALNPRRTIYDVKRLIGRRYDEKTVQQDKKYLPFEITHQNLKPLIETDIKGVKKTFFPEEISAMILIKMKEIAENFLGREVKNAVVTVPAYFNDAQRSSTKDAGTIAGLNVVRILNEPTAAAIAYGLDKMENDQNIMVFDLGGGTFDVSVLSIDHGVFEVQATNGDTHLGGEDFDQRVIDFFMKTIKTKHKVDISDNKRAIQKLKREVERGKRQLSSTHEARIEVENIAEGIDFSEILTRAKFEELNGDLFKSTLGPVQIALDDSGLKKDEINEIVLVGGSTRIPKIRQLVKQFFDGKEPNTGINPDEAVAYGAAVQGGIICGEESKETEGLVIIDATPLTLGIELEGGIMAAILPKGSFIPTKKSKVFSTSQDNQEQVTTAIYEGERPLVKDNHLLGKFDLKGIPQAPRGVPQIEVTFEIDANGILNVKAQDKGTGKHEEITITNDQGRLSKEEIEQMIREAEEFSEQDAAAKERVDARLSLENYVYSLKNSLEDKEKLKDKLSDEDKEIVEEAIKQEREWLDKNQGAEKEAFDEHLKELQDQCDPIVKKAYADKDKAKAEGQGGEEKDVLSTDDNEDEDFHDEL